MKTAKKPKSLEQLVKMELGKHWGLVSLEEKKIIREIAHYQDNSKKIKAYNALIGQYEQLGLV